MQETKRMDSFSIEMNRKKLHEIVVFGIGLYSARTHEEKEVPSARNRSILTAIEMHLMLQLVRYFFSLVAPQSASLFYVFLFVLTHSSQFAFLVLFSFFKL